MRKKKGYISEALGVIIMAAFLLLFGCIFIYGLIQCAQYNRAMKNPLYVDAEVTAHRQSEDSEGDTIYIAYVSYTVGDTYYKNIRYDSDSRQSDLPEVGTRLHLAADPSDPGTLLLFCGAGPTTLSFGVILCMLLSSLQRDLRRKRLSHKNRWVTESDVMERDLHIIIRGRMLRVLALMLTLLFITFRLVFPLVFGKGYWIAAAVSAALWLVGVLNAGIATYKVNNGMYEIKAEKLVRKEEITDIEGDSTYRLYYESAGRSWNKNVPSYKYLGAEVGSTIYSVYLAGRRRPIMHYDHQGDATG